MTSAPSHLLRGSRGGSFQDIRYDVAEGIAKLTICRPERRNAFRPQTLFELTEGFTMARDDPDVGAIILTGEGPTRSAPEGTRRSEVMTATSVTTRSLDAASAVSTSSISRSSCAASPSRSSP